MNKLLKIPPKSPLLLTPPQTLAVFFSKLIGSSFLLTGKTRTDGSNIRKLIAQAIESYQVPALSPFDEYEIVPPRRKGVPKITCEFIDTYIVTSGNSYNLQVWNRLPAAKSLLVKYESGERLRCFDVRFVFVKIDIDINIITSVVILTPKYIEQKFGKFGKPTIKNQLLISKKVRSSIYEIEDRILSFPDSKRLTYFIRHDYKPPEAGMVEDPDAQELFSIFLLKELVAKKLIGFKLSGSSTKVRGQALEKKVLELLGYQLQDTDLLYGAFPDIKNQLLEVKVQDSPTVDLGRFSPEKEETIISSLGLTTFDVRYLIALTNPESEVIEGIIIAPGEKLGELFSYVSTESFKCQRSIPMEFFKKYNARSVFNPD